MRQESFKFLNLAHLGGSGDVENNSITDDIMYIGKIQIKLNDGKNKFFIFPSRLQIKRIK